jgi:hypothetical protein
MKNFKFSPVVFGIIILCFFLPFINISCGGLSVVKFSGYELAFGTSISENSGFGHSDTRKVDAEPLAALSWIAAAGGLVFCFINNKKKNMILSGISAAGVVLMVILAIKLSNDASKQPGLTMDFGIGYYLALIFFIANSGLSYFNYKNEAAKTNVINGEST